eukprot:CAMPEP_0201692650 /NCGR_PEP_ID=MMETSP0578-20130828/5475_1 /ASSEMBLY_ACC=CAM_ASM_000663 /TAXON_ID=267565 /ORGANISM="Skeletonema grethea, Strain CCMP 1804" /LENGTH=730 /DNA_ID=CAMNT_0048178061 /DNA_START=80 /DNA_END=2269 /DNA_ORIENTATION=-
MTVASKAADTAAESASTKKYDRFSTSSSVTDDNLERYISDNGTVDVETGNANSSYDQFLQFIETTEKSKHGVSEHSDTGLLPSQIKRSSEDSRSAEAMTNTHDDDGVKMASTESTSSNNGNNIGASRKSRMSSSRRASTTEERQNPFAYREGNALLWRNVNMTLKAKKKKDSKQSEQRKLLNSVWGEVPPGEITAIMGPSGAGKTSLLNILAGRSKSNKTLDVQSEIRMQDYLVDTTNIAVRKQIAFVAQDDSLSFTATPREAIRFSAKLRLPRITTDEEIEVLTDKMLNELGLMDCADTMIGGELIKGISGGERKRTSVGVELVTKPSLVFLDEPTSGLDSFSAMQVIKVLKKIANAGCSVLFTIHQPSSDVFNSFDRLILLNKGMVMYQGKVNDVPAFFAKHNHPMPPNYNPADHIMEVAQQYSQEQLLREGFFARDERNLPEAIVPREEKELLESLGVSAHGDISDDEWKHVGFVTESLMLLKRELVHTTRNKKGVGARFAFTTFLSLLVGNIFFGVGNPSSFTNLSEFNSHFGAMVMILMMSMFGTAMPTLLSFPEERPVFLREYSTNHYGVIAYFMSRLAMEALITFLQIMVLLLIAYFMVDLQAGFFKFFIIEYGLAMSSTAVAVLLGCAVEDPKMATEFLPLLFVPQLLFAGFFVRTDLIPAWLQWAQYLCSLTYGVRLALLAEFGDCAKNENNQYYGPGEPNICANLLEVNQVDEDEKPLYW